MNIDEMDFNTRTYPFSHPLAKGRSIRISHDECRFLRTFYSDSVWFSSWWTLEYIRKLAIYCDRFNNQMPMALRRELLETLK